MKPAPVTHDELIHFPFTSGPENCYPVDVIVEKLAEGTRIRIPWQVEDGDLDALRRGEYVWLTIWGSGMPPVDVQVLHLAPESPAQP